MLSLDVLFWQQQQQYGNTYKKGKYCFDGWHVQSELGYEKKQLHSSFSFFSGKNIQHREREKQDKTKGKHDGC